MAAATIGVVSESIGTPASQQACHAPALQLLLRFLPFRAGGKQPNSKQQQQQDNRHALLDELQKNPLWRWSSLDEYRPSLQAALKNALPQDAHTALLDYVRMAADEEQQQRPRPAHQYRRSQQLTPAEAAAELHALYALAVVHVAAQQQPSQQHKGTAKHSPYGKQSLSDSDFRDMLKAYVALDDANNSNCSSKPAHQQQQSSQQAAAAAVQALYAFAQLADSVQQQQQQSRQEAPGQLQACKPIGDAAGSMYPGQNLKQQIDSGSSHQPQGVEQDLQALLQLAQLGAKASGIVQNHGGMAEGRTV